MICSDIFKSNLRQSIDNLPLTLCDSNNPQDISLNRIMLAVEFLLIFFVSPLILVGILFYNQQMFDKLTPLWTQGLTAFGVHFCANVIKKVGGQIAGK